MTRVQYLKKVFAIQMYLSRIKFLPTYIKAKARLPVVYAIDLCEQR